jgi:YjbE family integral membrane protein
MIDLGMFGTIHFNLTFLASIGSIILIDIVLSGDNAVLIAMAARRLPAAQKKRCIWLGASLAVVIRILLTFFIAQLLVVSYVKLVGGALIFWIAVKLFQGSDEELKGEAASMWQALKLILIADFTMSLDNMLAVAAASQGSLFLLLFGLGVSIPLVVFTSNLISMLMDKYPIIVVIGAAILGKVGGEMMITDPFVVKFLPLSLLASNMMEPSRLLIYAVEIVCAIGVIGIGKMLAKMKINREVIQGTESHGAKNLHRHRWRTRAPRRGRSFSETHPGDNGQPGQGSVQHPL